MLLHGLGSGSRRFSVELKGTKRGLKRRGPVDPQDQWFASHGKTLLNKHRHK